VKLGILPSISNDFRLIFGIDMLEV